MNLFENYKFRSQNPQEKMNRDSLLCIKEKLDAADAVVLGAGSGLSTAAGLTYTGERFHKNFAEFIDKYGMTDMYSAGFYPFSTQEEKWAYWSRHIYYNRYDLKPSPLYMKLLDRVSDKNYFVLTTNVDHQFQLAGFPQERIFATQGDYGLFQCAKACHKKLYDNEAQVRTMMAHEKDCKIPSDLVPKCPVCGGDMEVHLRCDGYFVEDEAWHRDAKNYEDFINKNKMKKLLFIELGVGMNTPGIIKYPFWQMTAKYPNAFYVCLNKGQAWIPDGLEDKSVCIDGDIGDVFDQLSEYTAGLQKEVGHGNDEYDS